jgi:hypothetical protein
MGSRDNDQGAMARRLRGREVPVFTRSHLGDGENVNKKEMKAPNKRAAMDDSNVKASNAGNKKRAALANLTNQTSSSLRQVAQIAGKSQVHCWFDSLYCSFGTCHSQT